MLSREYKVVMGQAFPLFEAGGQTPLLLAALNGRSETVALLLSGAVPEEIRAGWLSQEDSFGRTALQALRDKLALCDEGPRCAAIRKALAEVHAMLCAAAGLDHAAGLLQVPSREVAEQRKVAHNRTLRKRWLVADTRRKAASRKEGLAAVATHYTPRHPQVYSSTIAPSDLWHGGAIVPAAAVPL